MLANAKIYPLQLETDNGLSLVIKIKIQSTRKSNDNGLDWKQNYDLCSSPCWLRCVTVFGGMIMAMFRMEYWCTAYCQENKMKQKKEIKKDIEE